MARLALACVASAMLLNFIFNIAATSMGWPHPYSTFLHLPHDRFADFFKLAFSYPGGPIRPTNPIWGVDTLLETFKTAVVQLAGSKFNHFHEPPLPSLMAFSWRQAMTFVDPMLLFVGLVGLGLGTLIAVVARGIGPGAGALPLSILAVFNYPVALMIDRGHLFSLLCVVCLIAGILRSERQRHRDWLTPILFGIAINIRPNAGLFVVALFLARWGWSAGHLIRFAALVVGIFIASLALVGLLYPPYDLAAFGHGMRDYASVYLAGNVGLAHGSSLLGAAKALFGFGMLGYWLSLLAAGLLLTYAVIVSRNRRLDYCEFIYLVAIVYALGTQVFADYHLMIFLAPLVLLARQGGISRSSHWAVLLGSCFVLSPKNYIFHEYAESSIPWSWQIIANPLVLAGSSAYILYRAFGRPSDRPLIA